MFNNISPESAGISSRHVKQFIEYLNNHNLAMHSVLLAKGTNIFAEIFWKPFHRDSIHRMYSQTKSFVGIAVSELIALGKIGLHDKIISYFPDKLPEKIPELLQRQTIEDMLTMRTCMSGNYWFGNKVIDRLKYYFSCTPNKEPGKDFYYDSDASYVLSCLVERVTGKKLIEFLREICLDIIGFSKEAFTLDAPGGYTWGDSALLCRTEDILLFAKLLANGGSWGGEQLLHREWVEKALVTHVWTEKYGYGYQIWKNKWGGFTFRGMHGQYMHYNPKTDIIFACTAGNKTTDNSEQIISDGLENFIFNKAGEKLPENEELYREYKSYADQLRLYSLKGGLRLPIESKINGRYELSENPMGIEWINLCFKDEQIVVDYKNKQGIKKILCGRGKNIFQQFPQTGYSKTIGGLGCEGHTYRCAISSAWKTDSDLLAKVQIIDNYLGTLDISFHFEDNYMVLTMEKDAEDFLNEYNGTAVGNRAES